LFIFNITLAKVGSFLNVFSDAEPTAVTAVTTLKKRVVTAQPTNDVPVTAVTNVTTKKEQ
jgi:hypothetical protein